MSNVVNLKDVRIILEAGQTMEQVHADTCAALDRLLCANVREFDGRMLRKTRDHILQLQYLIIVSSPEAHKLVEARVGTLNLDKPLSEDDALDLAFDQLAPELAKVSVHFAR